MRFWKRRAAPVVEEAAEPTPPAPLTFLEAVRRQFPADPTYRFIEDDLLTYSVLVLKNINRFIGQVTYVEHDETEALIMVGTNKFDLEPRQQEVVERMYRAINLFRAENGRKGSFIPRQVTT